MCGAWVCVQPCFKEVTAVFLRVKQGLLAEKTCFQAVCLSPSPAKQSRVESSLHVSITHHHGKRALQPSCLSNKTTEAKRALQPTCQARGWRSVAICHRIQHRANLHNGPAMATCHKGLPKAPCLVLAHGLAGRKRWIFQTITVIHVLYLCKQYNTATTVPRYTHLSSTGSMMMARH